MLIQDGVNPYPYALNEVEIGDFIVLRNILAELRKRKAEDEYEKLKLLLNR